MNSQFINLADIIDRTLLDCYLDEVCLLACRISNPKGKTVLEIGDPAKVPLVAPAELETISSSPLPMDINGGRVAGLYAKGAFVGYAVVSAKSDGQAAAADFVFQLMNHSIQMQLEKEGLDFTAEYLKNLIAVMQRMSQKTAAVFDRKRAAELFTEECERLFAVRSGAVIVRDDKKLHVIAAFGPEFSDFPCVSQVLETRKFFVSNAPSDEPIYSGRESPKSVMAVPLLAGKSVVGAIYMRDKETGPFSVEDQRLAQTLAAVLGSTIANIQLHETLVASERQRATLSRYLSPNLLKEVVEEGNFATLGGKRMKTAILFTDIRKFTKISEKVSPEQMVAQLNEYFEEMARIIFEHDGTLDKFVGDMVMVLFGAPKPMADASARAILTAIDMQKCIQLLNQKWAAEGKPLFNVGMGVNAGDVVFGNIGSSQAMGLTVIGDNVNQAQRLEAYAGPGEILVSEAVANEVVGNGFSLSKLGLVEVKGKQVVAYRVAYQ